MVNHTSIQSGFFPCRSDWRFINQGPRCTYIFCYFGIRQTVKEHIVCSRWPPWRFSALTPPPPPRCQLLTVIKNLLTQHCRGNLLLRIRLVLVFHRVLQLQRANNIQFREWHFVSVALVWRGIQLWNRTQPNSKNADFFPIQLIIVKIILFRNCMLCQSFTIDYFLIWPKWDKQLRRLNF